MGFWNRINLDVELYNKEDYGYVDGCSAVLCSEWFGKPLGQYRSNGQPGVEVMVNGDVIRTKDFSWNLSANFSYNKNKITELYNGVDEYEIASTNLKYVVGRSSTEFYINRYAGVNPANGDALWYTKDGEITTEFRDSDKVMTGKSFCGSMARWIWYDINVERYFTGCTI